MHRRPKGLLLFIVAVLLVVLSLSGVSLLLLMRTEHDATKVRMGEIRLENAMRSAAAVIHEAVETPLAQRQSIGGLRDNESLFHAVPLFNEQDNAGESILFSVLAPEFHGTIIEGIRYGLANESVRLHLGAILQWDREQPGLGRETLLKLPGMTATAADSILDWIDPDDNPRSNGAETGWYESQGVPYRPRGDIPVFLEELLLVRDVTGTELFGNDDAFNFCNVQVVVNSSGWSGSEFAGGLSTPDLLVSPLMMSNMTSNNAPLEDSLLTAQPAPTGIAPWSYLLTVFSAENDQDKINLNGTDLNFLYSELQKNLGKETADFVIFYRQFGPATTPAAEPESTVSAVSAVTTVPGQPDLTLAAKFTLVSPLDLLGATVSIPATSPGLATSVPAVAASPLLLKSPISAARSNSNRILELLDRTSTFTQGVIKGRVNVNEAPRPVLSAIPRLTTLETDRIMATRAIAGATDKPERRHAAWLYLEGIVDLEKMKFLYNKITTGGDVYRGQIVSVNEATGAFSRAEIVVDGTFTPSRQVFYKDLTTYGRGFQAEILLRETPATRPASP